jgi:hypothetical protein
MSEGLVHIGTRDPVYSKIIIENQVSKFQNNWKSIRM